MFSQPADEGLLGR